MRLKAGVRKEAFTDRNAVMTAISLLVPGQVKAAVLSYSAGCSPERQSKLTWRGRNRTAHKLWPLAAEGQVVKL